MITRNKKQIVAIAIAGFLSYLLFGLFDSMKGPALPALLKDIGFNYSLGGTIIMGQYAGYFVAMLCTGIITDYLGKKITLFIAGVCMIFGVVGYSFSSQLVFLFSFILFIGFGLGSLELCGCNIIAEVYQEKKGRYLNIAAAIAGIGAIITPAAAGYLLDQGTSWRMVYRYGLVAAVPIVFYFFIIKYPYDSREKSGPAKEKDTSVGKTLYSKKLILMYIVNFSYMAAEIGIATWMADFYINAKHFSVLQASAYLSLFFISMTLGRLLGSLFVDKIGHMKSILFAATLAGIFILGGVFAPGSLSLLLAFSGFFYSILFPTAAAVVSEIAPQHSARALGIHFAFGGVGGMVGPWLVGIANDLFGIELGMALNGLFFAGIIIPILVLFHNANIERMECTNQDS